jgi:4-hydroxy-4-methyl-2-oxoglutarate aldolase
MRSEDMKRTKKSKAPANFQSEAEREELLRRYAKLRVTDVRDGLDSLMLHQVGSMSPDIRPIWRTRACGIARTARYVPFNGRIPTLTPDRYWKWLISYYHDHCRYPWAPLIQPGDFCVIDMSGIDCGLMGSNNTLDAVRHGARGFVTSGGGVRDTDEIILQKVPFWAPYISQSRAIGLIDFDAMDIPVCVGGVTVHPGDVVVADGDGVIVVPRAVARSVAEEADGERRRDMAGRRAHYQALGLPLDETVTDDG